MSKTALPEIVPIFPLTGVSMLPGTELTLSIFEPRYRNMVADCLEEHRHMAMVQPLVPSQDSRPPPDARSENPPVYAVGCVGRIDQSEALPDGRYNLILRGVSRYHRVKELPLLNGYRRVSADYTPYVQDLREQESRFEASRLMSVLKGLAASGGLSFATDKPDSLPGVALLNGLCMPLPLPRWTALGAGAGCFPTAHRPSPAFRRVGVHIDIFRGPLSDSLALRPAGLPASPSETLSPELRQAGLPQARRPGDYRGEPTIPRAELSSAGTPRPRGALDAVTRR